MLNFAEWFRAKETLLRAMYDREPREYTLMFWAYQWYRRYVRNKGAQSTPEQLMLPLI